ncbi:MAG: molybdopterin molybdotransferase MoeA [Deltaproteobacteria bacterium]|nr:molybdopterin molybdotransferase MoeA [Deltaproteobacteria bacterium]
MIPVQTALDTILKEVAPLGLESVQLQNALGRTLGEDAISRWPNPMWNNSAMDGYAVRSNDTLGASEEAPVRLTVIYDLPAGHKPDRPVGQGEAVRIMTGAPMPEGADAVVMVEKTGPAPDNGVFIRSIVKHGEHVRLRGEDFQKGDVAVKKGAVIRPAETAMLAAIGSPFVFVYKRPRVAVVSTGDELVDINQTPPPGKITNSNGYTLAALVREAGAEPIQLGIARDNRASLLEKLKQAAEADCIVSSGGVSVGDFDFVKDVLKELGSRMIFWKVAMKPGKPLAFGVIGGKPAFGLPGNPVSSMVAFEQFVRPALLKMSGRLEIERTTLPARLEKDLKIKSGRVNFIRAKMTIDATGLCVTPLAGQGSALLTTMVSANAYIIVPKESEGLKKGDMVKVQPFDMTAFYK